MGERISFRGTFLKTKCLLVIMYVYIYKCTHQSQFLRFVIVISVVLMVGKCLKQEVNFYSSSPTENLQVLCVVVSMTNIRCLFYNFLCKWSSWVSREGEEKTVWHSPQIVSRWRNRAEKRGHITNWTLIEVMELIKSWLSLYSLLCWTIM